MSKFLHYFVSFLIIIILAPLLTFVLFTIVNLCFDYYQDRVNSNKMEKIVQDTKVTDEVNRGLSEYIFKDFGVSMTFFSDIEYELKSPTEDSQISGIKFIVNGSELIINVNQIGLGGPEDLVKEESSDLLANGNKVVINGKQVVKITNTLKNGEKVHFISIPYPVIKDYFVFASYGNVDPETTMKIFDEIVSSIKFVDYEDWQLYKSKNFDLSFLYPKGFKVLEGVTEKGKYIDIWADLTVSGQANAEDRMLLTISKNDLGKHVVGIGYQKVKNDDNILDSFLYNGKTINLVNYFSGEGGPGGGNQWNFYTSSILLGKKKIFIGIEDYTATYSTWCNEAEESCIDFKVEETGKAFFTSEDKKNAVKVIESIKPL